LDKWNLLLAEKDFAIQLNKGLNDEENFYNNKVNSFITNTLQIPNQYFTSARTDNYYINLLPTGDYQNVPELQQAKFIKSSVFKRIPSAEFTISQDPQDLGVYSEIRKTKYLNGVADLVVQGNLTNPKEDLLSFSYHDYQYDKKGIYKALTVEEAYNNIQLNQGILYWLQLKDTDVFLTYQELNVIEFRVDVTKTRIIYIEPDEWLEDQEWTHFLLPFYMFEGTAALADGREADFAFLTEALPQSDYK